MERVERNEVRWSETELAKQLRAVKVVSQAKSAPAFYAVHDLVTQLSMIVHTIGANILLCYGNFYGVKVQ